MRQKILLATALLFAVACSDDPTGPDDDNVTPQMRADAAESVGAIIASDVESMTSSPANSSALFNFGADLNTDDCVGVLGVYVCTTGVGDLSGEARLTFRDEGGTQQDDYDPSTTASTMIDLDIDGSILRAGLDVDFTAERDLMVSGMLGTETARTWSGNGTVNASSSMHDNARTYSYTTTTVFTGVEVTSAGQEQSWPTDGTATTNINLQVVGGPDAGESATLTAVIEFNGTVNVPLKIGNVTYTLNLDSGEVS